MAPARFVAARGVASGGAAAGAALPGGIWRAPDRGYTLSPDQTVVAVKNALRYVPASLHGALAREFYAELKQRGRIYGYRYRPEGFIKAKPIGEYRGILEARALQLNIDNNLDFRRRALPVRAGYLW